MKLRVLLLSLLVAAVGLTIIPIAAPQTKATTVTVTAKEFKFLLSTKTAKAGAITFKVVNKGKIAHDFKIAGKKTPLLQPGKSATLKVTLKKGMWPYKCTVDAHASAGMKGTFKAI